jgi:magnesium transporter
MINAFELENGRLRQFKVSDRAALEHARPIWVDFVAPTDAEQVWARELFGLELSSPEEMADIEASARFVETESGELLLRSDFLVDQEEGPRNVPVLFVLKDRVLFSVHDEDLPVLRLLRMRARTQPGYVEGHIDVLLDVYATDVEHSADALEGVYSALEEVSSRVLKMEMTDEAAAEALGDIARQEDINGRIRRNVMDTRRAISVLMRNHLLSPKQSSVARQILRDIDSLDGHTSFLFEKVNFLMDATVGFVNINQNKIIKIFSVAAVALLPPTLIASVYGMNFGAMPELRWAFGYPFALGLMVLSVVAPIWYFRRRGWLK